jgi:hypothetical protein
MGTLRISQSVIEVGATGDSTARISQSVLEVGVVGDSTARISQAVLEVGIVPPTAEETARVGDTVSAALVSAGGDLSISVLETLRAAETGTTVLSPLEASLSEGVSPHDTAATGADLAVSLGESLRALEALTVVVAPLVVSLGETVHVTDGPPVLSIGATLTVSVSELVRVSEIVGVVVESGGDDVVVLIW